MRWARAIATQTRWRCPPDKEATGRVARPSTWVRSIASLTASSSAADHWCRID